MNMSMNCVVLCCEGEEKEYPVYDLNIVLWL